MPKGTMGYDVPPHITIKRSQDKAVLGLVNRSANMRSFIGLLVAASVLAAAYFLGSESSFCFSSGSLTERVIEQSVNRSSSRSAVRFVVKFAVNGIDRSAGGIYQPASSTQPTWAVLDHKLAEAWMERHPIGTAMEVAYVCKLPAAASVKGDGWKLSILIGLFISFLVYLFFLVAGWLIVTKLVKFFKA